MPKASEDRFFGGKRGAASEAHAAMVKQYGAKRGESVYYATLNRNKKRRGGLSAQLRHRK